MVVTWYDFMISAWATIMSVALRCVPGGTKDDKRKAEWDGMAGGSGG